MHTNRKTSKYKIKTKTNNQCAVEKSIKIVKWINVKFRASSKLIVAELSPSTSHLWVTLTLFKNINSSYNFSKRRPVSRQRSILQSHATELTIVHRLRGVLSIQGNVFIIGGAVEFTYCIDWIRSRLKNKMLKFWCISNMYNFLMIKFTPTLIDKVMFGINCRAAHYSCFILLSSSGVNV